eukprot:TRINITY_DN2877_c0_g1_i1.p1 TRINITY_DN2877_c0_g1~~TRINITY_DN2877_c0_g1_i1.p1  ORF type:complete len:682 (+),score=155.55 TRINITY_DN2877_c0_g1_i1:58-2046(+)
MNPRYRDDDSELEEYPKSQSNEKQPNRAGTLKDRKPHEIISENIQKFFKYNAQNLVRPLVAVDDLEQKKARTWVFFLIIVQLIVCVGYGFLLSKVPRDIVHWIVAAPLCFYYGLKLLLILIFNVKRLIFCRCVSSDYDPESADYEEIFICIPVYNESKAALERAISSVTNSNYTKHKLYCVFIVDGNKGSTFQSLMELLEGPKFAEKVAPNTRVVKHGSCNGVNYSVFLKEQTRGKRDSQWLFIELVRNIFSEHKPPYLVFLDSDTSFESNALRYMVDTLRADADVAGVCGKVKISNYGFSGCTKEREKACESWDNVVFRLSTLVIIASQYYEYCWYTFFNKHAEASLDAVTSLSPHFAMYRTDILTNVDATTQPRSPSVRDKMEKSFASPESRSDASFFYVASVQQVLPLVTEDFFSKPTLGLINRNIYGLSSERTLTGKVLELGYKCIYDPRIQCETEAPDSVAKLLHQRRRWNNTTFLGHVMSLVTGRLWIRPRTILNQIFALFDLIGMYLLITHAVFVIHTIWTPFLREVVDFSPEIIIFAWVLIQVIVISSTKLENSDMFYVLNTFTSSVMMGASVYFFVRDNLISQAIDPIIDDPAANWKLTVIYLIFPAMHVILSIFSPASFFNAIAMFLMFPTMTITVPIYSFFRMDDFSWGSR